MTLQDTTRALTILLGIVSAQSVGLSDCTIQLKDCEGEPIHGVFFEGGSLSRWQDQGSELLTGVVENGAIVVPSEHIDEGEVHVFVLLGGLPEHEQRALAIAGPAAAHGELSPGKRITDERRWRDHPAIAVERWGDSPYRDDPR